MKRAGLITRIAHGSNAGFKELRNIKFDFLLCDINMPNINGWEFGSKVLKKYPDIKIIFMSAELNEDIKGLFKNYILLQKPFSLNELLDVLLKKEAESIY